MQIGISIVALAASLPWAALADEPVQLDPFAQATAGIPACPVVKPRLYTTEEMRIEAHSRIEKGTRCALDGTCEPGGAYKRDAEINERVRQAVASDKRFADTSIWVTTSRKWVAVKGCLRTRAQQRALTKFVAEIPGVERVFDELKVAGSGAR
jgi:BON domain